MVIMQNVLPNIEMQKHKLNVKRHARHGKTAATDAYELVDGSKLPVVCSG